MNVLAICMLIFYLANAYARHDYYEWIERMNRMYTKNTHTHKLNKNGHSGRVFHFYEKCFFLYINSFRCICSGALIEIINLIWSFLIARVFVKFVRVLVFSCESMEQVLDWVPKKCLMALKNRIRCLIKTRIQICSTKILRFFGILSQKSFFFLLKKFFFSTEFFFLFYLCFTQTKKFALRLNSKIHVVTGNFEPYIQLIAKSHAPADWWI